MAMNYFQKEKKGRNIKNERRKKREKERKEALIKGDMRE